MKTKYQKNCKSYLFKRSLKHILSFIDYNNGDIIGHKLPDYKYRLAQLEIDEKGHLD